MPLCRLFVFSWIVLAIGNDASSAQITPSSTLTPSDLFEKASPCVVKIISKDEDGRAIGTGSGFMIVTSPDTDSSFRRWIVTNHHVIRAAVSVSIDPPFADPRDANPSAEFRHLYASVAEVIAENQRNDLAVLAGVGTGAPTLPLGDDTLPPIGTRVFVISSPEGLKNTLSEGLISGLRERENGEQWIQITAPISPGSSGGPVLTADGKVIGVVVASHDEGQNLNFAVPASALRRLLKTKTERRWIWKGSSINKEEEDAFSDVQIDIYNQACGVKDSTDDCVKGLRARAESNDQLSLLFRARKDRQFETWAPTMRAKVCSAQATLHRAIKEKPSDYEYLAYYYLGKLTGDTWTCLTCAFENTSASPGEVRRICYDPAIPLLKKSTELNPKFSPSFARLAEMYLETEHYPEALVAAEFLVALVPNCWEAYLMRGKAFAHLKRIGAGDEDFATATKLRPGSFELYKEIFSTYSTVDNPRAFEAGKTALGLPLPADKEDLKRRQIDRLLLWHNMGMTYRRLGDHDNAAHAFEEYIRMGQQADPQFSGPDDIKDWLARYRAARPGNGRGSGD